MLLNTYFQGKCTGIDTFDVFCSASSFVWNKKKAPQSTSPVLSDAEADF